MNLDALKLDAMKDNDMKDDFVKNELIRDLSKRLHQQGLGQFAPSNTIAAKTLNTIKIDTADQDLVHFLKRTSYGFSSDELAFAQSIGLEAYLEYQLAHDSIDDAAIDGLLNQLLPSLQMSYNEIFERLRTDDQFDPGFELIAATLIRAAFKPSQLHEMMVEFWSNHFNVNIFDGPIRYLKVVDDRQNIRPHALGKFKDLLHANAKSPAMLFYLDGLSNTVDGPNENYARELMELHTLGVDGGYSEADVKEVARCFTGWTVYQEEEDLFYFYAPNHDFGSKTVLGETIPAGNGIEDGEQVLDLLASHPSTAQFIAKKLCIRFINDSPAAEAVAAVATTFLDTDGDIKAMLRTLFSQPAFIQASEQKFKRPIEYVLSLFRSLQPLNSNQFFELIYRQVRNLGQLPFAYPAPTGYSDVTNGWLNTNALLDRWNLGFAIAYGDLDLGRNPDNNRPNTQVGADFLQIPVLGMMGSARTAAAITDNMLEQTLHQSISKNDRDALIKLAADGGSTTEPMPLDQALDRARAVLAAILASRHFQQR